MLLIESTFDLSDEEYKRVQMHAEKLFTSWTDTGDIDVEMVEAALQRVMARAQLPPPTIVWCDSIDQMQTQAIPAMVERTRARTAQSPQFQVVPGGLSCMNADPITNAFNRALSKANLTWPPAWQQRIMQIVGFGKASQWRESCARARLLMEAKVAADGRARNEIPYPVVWGRWAGDFLPLYAAPSLALASGDWGQELLSQLADLFTLRISAFGYIFWHRYVFVCRNPISIHLDNFGRLSCDNGPAVEFADGDSLYAWAGVLVDKELVMHPERLDAERIGAEPNIELRRVMIERYGIARYLEETGAAVISEDEFGVLLRKEVPGDEPILMVKVLNSTAEADGSFKEYFLRVPPGVESPHEGIAWTFNMDPQEYNPQFET